MSMKRNWSRHLITGFLSDDVREEQTRFNLDDLPTVSTVFERIRTESRDQSEKGRWFEQLFLQSMTIQIYRYQ